MVLGQKTLLHCGNACAYTLGCTAFDVRPNDAKKLDCNLFSHSNVEPASGVPGKYLSSISSHANHQSWNLNLQFVVIFCQSGTQSKSTTLKKKVKFRFSKKATNFETISHMSNQVGDT